MKPEIIHIEDTPKSEVLTKKASLVHFPLDQPVKSLISEMKLLLMELGGVGLAAPQIKVGKQIILIYIPEEAALLRDKATSHPMQVLINPAYKGVEKFGKATDLEACYSVRSKAGKVKRYNEIELQYQDEQGVKHTSHEQGFYARVLQHEIDHLDGVLITDRLGPDDVQGTLEEMMWLRREELPEEKKALFDKLIKKKHLKK